ncbi:arabinofuranosidase catalytic domain-containing protein [Streptomyces sp. FXJ1.172]|nr:arabinofuranosidase catalytic domain-containing protein [Streptomyces sp. FXJ1.172]WEO93253.1 arabinofuranosidase catalytic domain-containing protein [Streptomyces sp. FXJ1.172]
MSECSLCRLSATLAGALGAHRSPFRQARHSPSPSPAYPSTQNAASIRSAVLGGGDGCRTGGGADLSAGTFYEGVVVGHPSDATDNAVQADGTSADSR